MKFPKERHNLLKSMEVIFVMSFMDLKLKYQNSILGFFWSFLKPMLQFVVYFTIFAKILKVGGGEDYALRLFYGILLWTWFAESTSIGLGIFLSKKSIITKIKTNKIFPVLSSYLTPLLNYILNFIIFAVLYIFIIKSFPISLFTFTSLFIFIYSMFSISILIISLNFILGNLNVLYRDVQPIWELVLTYGVFLTPIIYNLPIPNQFKPLYFCLNPLALPLINLESIFFKNILPLYGNTYFMILHTSTVCFIFILAIFVHKLMNHKVIDFL